jgi:hypothetical protein
MNDHTGDSLVDDDMHEAEPVASAASFVDSDMEDDKGSSLVCKNNTKSQENDENVCLSELKAKGAVKTSSSKAAANKKKSASVTPKELYDRIKQSRDKLFFISYTAPDDDSAKKSNDSKEKWYLVRVDLDTCKEVEEAQNCETTGQYYVEFYTKATDDQTKSDGQSRWWLIWNAFSFVRGEMIIGMAREFNPNHKAAIKRRLVELSKRRSLDGKGDMRPQFHPNLDRKSVISCAQFEFIVLLTDNTVTL